MNETKPKELMSNLGESVGGGDRNPTPETLSEKMSNVQNVNGRSVVVGQLPDDFLRLDQNSSSTTTAAVAAAANNHGKRSQIEIDEELAASLQQQYDMAQRNIQWNSNYQAYLSITFVEAHLVKNYGLMNMSLYVRIRIGNTIYETRTSKKGGKDPKWNETFRCYLPIGVDSFSIELYNDCLFTQDELIAYTSYKIPEQFLRFNAENPEHSFEEKIPLSGKQGDNKEGEIVLAINSKPVTAETARAYYQRPVFVPNHSPHQIMYRPPILANPLIVHQSPIPATQLLPPNSALPTAIPPQPIVQIKDEDVTTLVDMFPKIDIEIIKSMLITERGNLERAISNLLELNTTT